VAVLWNQGLRGIVGVVFDSKGVTGKVFKNVSDRNKPSAVSDQRSAVRQASGDRGSGNVVDCSDT
jgi:hypothetical protein